MDEAKAVSVKAGSVWPVSVSGGHSLGLQDFKRLKTLLDCHDYWLREVRKIHPKHLARFHVAPSAKDHLAEAGSQLFRELAAAGLLPLSSGTMKSVEARVAALKDEELDAAQSVNRRVPTLIEKIGRVELRRHRIRQPRQEKARPPIAIHSSHLEAFEDVASRVFPGRELRTRKAARDGKGIASQYVNVITRSPDGNVITIAYGDTSETKTITKTVQTRGGWVSTVVEVKYSKPRGYLSGDWERETTLRPVEDGELRHDAVENSESRVKAVGDGLGFHGWRNFLREFVRVNPDTGAFMLGNREGGSLNRYRLSYRLSKTWVEKWKDSYGREHTRERVEYVGDLLTSPKLRGTVNPRGQLIEPYISELAAKLTELQRIRPEQFTFEEITADTLPWLLAHIDHFTPSERYVRSSPEGQRRRDMVEQASTVPKLSRVLAS